MKVLLNVPFAENSKAKTLGCKFDRATKKWFVEDIENLEPFMKWMPDHLKKPHQKTTRKTSIR